MSSEKLNYFEKMQRIKETQDILEGYEKLAVRYRRSRDNISLAGILVSIIQENNNIAKMYTEAAEQTDDEEKKDTCVRLCEIYKSLGNSAKTEFDSLGK